MKYTTEDWLKLIEAIEDCTENPPTAFASIGDRGDADLLNEDSEYIPSGNEFSGINPMGQHQSEIEHLHKELTRHYKPLNGHPDINHPMNALSSMGSHSAHSHPGALPHFFHREGIEDYTKDSMSVNQDLFSHDRHLMHEGYSPKERYKAASAIKQKYFDLNSKDPNVVPKNLYALDHLLSNHQTSPRDLVLYAGIKRNPNHLLTNPRSRNVYLPAYTSSSLSYTVASRYSVKGNRHLTNYPEDSENEHVLKIHYPTGSSGAYLGVHSYYHTEREFLLPRGLTLNISKKPISTFETQSGKKMHVWDAAPVSGHKLKKTLVEDYIPNQQSELIHNARKDNPQLTDFNALLDDLTNSGIRTWRETGTPEMFVATQRDFDWDKVNTLKDRLESNDDPKPIVVSKDNAIIDGHHRWLAYANLKERKIMPVFRINLNYDQFIKFIDGKPYITYKGV